MLHPFLLLVFFSSFLYGCAQQGKSVSGTSAEDRPIAFPGAEGYGKFTTGGRGGKVWVVSNLNDAGPGSLREAVESKGSRFITFAVSGTIHLESPLRIKGGTTLAGQTAPGAGICLADQPVTLNGDNIIVRYLRIRMGDRHQNKGMVPGSGHDDAFGGTRRNRIIIDHCSFSWSTDEVFSLYAGDSTTVQWNIMSEPLNFSYHFEKGDTNYERHGYGGILGGRHISIHHNLYAHCVSRTPRFDGNRNMGGDTERADFRNNVLYNWGSNNVYGGEGGTYNIVGNYYKWGPATGNSVKSRIANPFKKEGEIPYGTWFVSGNYVDGSEAHTANNWLGVTLDRGTPADLPKVQASEPWNAEKLPAQTATEAYERVLQTAGASLPERDTLDARIITDVRNRTGRIIDVPGGYPHGTPYHISARAWPDLKGGLAPADSDGDGMPDAWEKAQGLNPKDASDASGYKQNRLFTNIEVYVNSLVN